MTRVEEKWEQKLATWALGEVSGAGSVGVSTAYLGELFGEATGAPRQPLPPLGEYFDLDRLVRKLSDDHYEAVRVWYVWSVGTYEDRARSMRIHVNTLRERVRSAKYRLEDMEHAQRYAHQRNVGVRPTAM